MIIDLHTHTLLGSPDSLIKPRELVEVAKRVGLDGVCITEHGNRKALITWTSTRLDSRTSVR